jgi:hypothetical protein
MWNTNGSWPDVSLKQACAKPDEKKRQKATGTDPRQASKAEKSRAEASLLAASKLSRANGLQAAPGWAEGHSSKTIRPLKWTYFPSSASVPFAPLPRRSCRRYCGASSAAARSILRTGPTKTAGGYFATGSPGGDANATRQRICGGIGAGQGESPGSHYRAQGIGHVTTYHWPV